MRVAQSMASEGPGALDSGRVGKQLAQGRPASSQTQTLSPGQPTRARGLSQAFAQRRG